MYLERVNCLYVEWSVVVVKVSSHFVFCFQLGDHDKALKIFVHKMKDFRAAEDYCDQVRLLLISYYCNILTER
jgi:hypothetical protein